MFEMQEGEHSLETENSVLNLCPSSVRRVPAWVAVGSVKAELPLEKLRSTAREGPWVGELQHVAGGGGGGTPQEGALCACPLAVRSRDRVTGVASCVALQFSHSKCGTKFC